VRDLTRLTARLGCSLVGELQGAGEGRERYFWGRAECVTLGRAPEALNFPSRNFVEFFLRDFLRDFCELGG
jgi:hypothetical protein